nr:DUF998 domain-containing protein [Candidatus Freyarchaeota archaeon]
MARLEKIGGTSRIILIGGVFAVVSMAVAIFCILGAVVTYSGLPFRFLAVRWLPGPIPWLNTGYSMLSQYISELGIGPSASMFNIGLIITGILSLPIFPGLLGRFRDSVIAKIAIVLGVVAAVALIGVGLFPMVVSSYHGLVSIIFFISIGIAIVLLSYMMLKVTFFPKAIAVYGFAFVVVDLIFLIFGDPLPEWAVFFVIVTWILAVGVWVLIKRKEIEA